MHDCKASHDSLLAALCLFRTLVSSECLPLHADTLPCGSHTVRTTAETGWYDGQTWVKPPTVLMRDRLVNNEIVLPALRRVRAALLAAASASLASVAALQLGTAAAPASVTAPQPPLLASQPCAPAECEAVRCSACCFIDTACPCQ